MGIWGEEIDRKLNRGIKSAVKGIFLVAVI